LGNDEAYNEVFGEHAVSVDFQENRVVIRGMPSNAKLRAAQLKKFDQLITRLGDYGFEIVFRPGGADYIDAGKEAVD
jgi:hypothetical protein